MKWLWIITLWPFLQGCNAFSGLGEYNPARFYYVNSHWRDEDHEAFVAMKFICYPLLKQMAEDSRQRCLNDPYTADKSSCGDGTMSTLLWAMVDDCANELSKGHRHPGAIPSEFFDPGDV